MCCIGNIVNKSTISSTSIFILLRRSERSCGLKQYLRNSFWLIITSCLTVIHMGLQLFGSFLSTLDCLLTRPAKKKRRRVKQGGGGRKKVAIIASPRLQFNWNKDTLRTLGMLIHQLVRNWVTSSEIFFPQQIGRQRILTPAAAPPRNNDDLHHLDSQLKILAGRRLLKN